METPNAAGSRPLEVVFVYALDPKTAGRRFETVLKDVYWVVREKIGSFASSSSISIIDLHWATDGYRYLVISKSARSGEKLPGDKYLICTKNMACGLREAQSLIGKSKDPNGIIFLFSDGVKHEGDFFDGVEDFAPEWPVHTFTVGGESYDEGLRAIAANSAGGMFYPHTVPADPWKSVDFLQYIDDILFTSKDDDDDDKPGSRPLEVVVVGAYNPKNVPSDTIGVVNNVHDRVRDKIGRFACTSRISYVVPTYGGDAVACFKRSAASGEYIFRQADGIASRACGLPEAHKLILSSQREDPNGIILFLFLSDGVKHEIDLFDGVEDFVSKWPVYTFTLGGDAYNEGLRAIAANSPGGMFYPHPVRADPWKSVEFSQYMDDILFRSNVDDDEDPNETTQEIESSARNGLVTMSKLSYSKKDVALAADSLTVGVELKAASSAAAREGLDLVVVLDIQRGSKGGDIKLCKVKKAMEFVVRKLTPRDRLSIVGTGSQGPAGLRRCPLRRVTPCGQTDLKAVIDSLTGSGFNLQEGLNKALAVINGRRYTEGRTANIFFLTDARGNTGNARSVDPGNVAVHTFGFGKKADHVLLNEIAKRSPGGTYSFVPDDSDLCTPFSQLLGGLLTIVAQDLQLTLTSKGKNVDKMEVSPGVDYKQTTSTNSRGEKKITLCFGTIFSGESRQVSVNFSLRASKNKKEYDATIAEAQHSYNAQQGLGKQPPQSIIIPRVPKPTVAPSIDAAALHAEDVRRQHADSIRAAVEVADSGELEKARYNMQDRLNAVEDIVLDNGDKMVSVLRAELLQLIKLMASKELYLEQGRPYAMATVNSHGLQRVACKGDADPAAHCLYLTPRMAANLQQAIQFEKDPNTELSSADQDLEEEVATNPLATVAGPLVLYLDNAIQSMLAIRKILVGPI